CHAAHTCPSDTGSYTCGDRGRPCKDGKTRVHEPLDEPQASAVQPSSLTAVSSKDERRFAPDRTRTPGSLNSDVTQKNIYKTICNAGWTRTVRPSSSYINALKQRQISELSLPGKAADYQEDHYVPLCVGGHPTDP